MPIPWLVILKSVPWTDVITNAPKVVDGAKKLWNTVNKTPAGRDRPISAPTAPQAAGQGGESESVRRLAARVEAMEAASAELHTQMRDSSELIRTLADQNTELIRHIEENRVRIRWLTGALLVLGLAVIGLLVAAAG